MEDSNEVVLEKYNLKSWFKSSVLGFFIGLAVIVPGISGSTIAILFKLYNKLIYALGNILKKFASCFLFLLPIIIGGLVGIVLGFFTIKELINLIPFAVSGLFAGLMSGSAPTVFNEIKGQKFSLFRIILLIVGILLPVILTVVTTLYSKNETSLVLDQDYYQYPLCILIGFVVAITQLIPGLSASAFLMSIGYFNHLVNSVSISFLKEHPLYLLIYLCLILGFIIGIIVVSKLINYLLSKFKITTFFMICGFVVGSIFAILFNPDIYQVYLSWASNDGNMILDLTLGIVLFVVGFAITLFFFFYEKKEKKPAKLNYFLKNRGNMKKIFVHLGKKWYLIVILAIAIILQCYCQLMLPEYMGNIQNQIRSVDVSFDEIWRYGGYMIGLSAAVVCLAFIQFYSASTVSAYVGQKLRTEMFKKVNSISLSDYNQFGTATLITRTTNDVEQIKNFTLMALRILVMSPTMMIIAIIKTAQERPSLLLVLGVILPIIIIFLLIILYVTAPYFKKIQEKIDNVTIVLRENLTGVRVVRAYDQEIVESKKFSKANKDLAQTIVKVNRIMSFTNPFINILFNLCFIGIYAFGFYLLSRITSDDTLKMYTEISELVTDITVVAQYSSQIMMSFLMFAMIFIMMPQALASARRVNEVLNIDSNKDKNTIYKDDSKYNEYKAKIEELYKKEESLTKPLLEKYKKEFNKEFNISLLKYQLEISSKEEYKNNKELAFLLKYEKIHQEYHLKRKKIREAFKNHVSDGADTSKENDLIAKSDINGVIEFKNVTFSYPDTDTPCIENISFKTKPGKTTAIIGSTGSGKSTIINLIPKFYKPTSGEILFDGVNLEDVSSECVREHLGFVPQTALLFKGTIRSNIQFGKKDATDEEIKEVLRVAQAKNFIDKLPDQLDTFVSQSGKNFSGGQKQRLCIARALVKKPEVYVFDDSFSALDFKTDAKLRNALKGYVGNSSIIVVAQRVSSILDADNIIVLHEGKIVDQGTHQELIARCNVYQDIVKSQLDSDEIEKTINLNKDYVLEGGE